MRAFTFFSSLVILSAAKAECYFGVHRENVVKMGKVVRRAQEFPTAQRRRLKKKGGISYFSSNLLLLRCSVKVRTDKALTFRLAPELSNIFLPVVLPCKKFYYK